MKVLVVGAGFAGSVYARIGAERGHDIHVIDSKPHVGGTAHDRMRDGVRVHDCGPHLFNTSNMRVVAWLSQFTDWTRYVHKSKSVLPDGTLVPFPLNRDSMKILRGLGYDTAPAIQAASSVRNSSARQWLRSDISDAVIEVFFERYVRKMWGLSLDALPASVVRRVHVRHDGDDRYFPRSRFQALPSDGYAALFDRMLAHPRISVQLDQPFRHQMREAYDMVLCSMSADLFYDGVHGPLPFRSIRFQTHVHATDTSRGCATINFTDDGPATRTHFWHRITGRGTAPFLETVETPCDPADNNDLRYYPVRTVAGAQDAILRKYMDMADTEKRRLKFIGRCGLFRYLNMDQTIAQSLYGAQQLFGQTPSASPNARPFGARGSTGQTAL